MDDDLWHIVVDCLAKRPADRPTAKALFSRITQIRSAQPHAMYRYLSAPLSSDHGTQVFERMKVFAREHSLNKITQFVGDEAQVAMDILYQVTIISSSFLCLIHTLNYRPSCNLMRYHHLTPMHLPLVLLEPKFALCSSHSCYSRNPSHQSSKPIKMLLYWIGPTT